MAEPVSFDDRPAFRPPLPQRGQTARRLACATLAAALLAASLPAARAADASTAASALSGLPLAVVVAAPSVVLSAGAALSVVAVEVAADGATWVLERASDGARLSVKVTGQASLAVGTAVTVIALGTGLLLSAAGRAVAFIPNAAGAALLHNERVSR